MGGSAVEEVATILGWGAAIAAAIRAAVSSSICWP
jgi:hypothetical protein